MSESEEQLQEIVKYLRCNPHMAKMVIYELVNAVKKRDHQTTSFWWKVLDRLPEDEWLGKLLCESLQELE